MVFTPINTHAIRKERGCVQRSASHVLLQSFRSLEASKETAACSPAGSH